MVPRAGIEPATPGFSVRPGFAGTIGGWAFTGPAPFLSCVVPPILPPSNPRLRGGSPMVGRTESFPGATYSGKFIRPSGSWKHGSERRSSNAGFFSKRRRELACFGMSTGGGLVGRVLFFFQRIALFVLGDDRLKLWITVQRWHFLPGCFY